jgi:hypothetical protein
MAEALGVGGKMMKNLVAVSILALAGCYYEPYGVAYGVRAVPLPVTRAEVEGMARAGVSEPAMVDVIEKRGAAPLTADDIVAVKKAGASDVVIAKMQATERRDPGPIDLDPALAYPDSYGPSYVDFTYGSPYWGYSYSAWRGYSSWGWGGRSCWASGGWGGGGWGGGRR